MAQSMLGTRTRAGRTIVDVLLIAGALIVAFRPAIDSFYRLQAGTGPTLLNLLGAALVALIIPAAVMGLTDVPRHRVLLFPATFLAISTIWGLVVTLWVPMHGFVPMVFRILGMVAAFLAFASLSARRPKWVVPLLVMMAIPPMMVAIRQMFGGGVPLSGQVNEYVRESVTRVTGTFVHPSALGIFAAFMMVFAFAGYLLATRLSRRAAWAGFAAVNGVVLLMTHTRVAWIAAPVAVVVIALACRRPLVPLAMLGSAVAIAARATAVQQRLSGFSSLDVRQRLWEQLVANLTVGDAILGFGLGRVNAMVTFASMQAGIPLLNQAHNDYLRLLLETGIIGVALHTLSLVGVAVVCWRALTMPSLSALGRHLSLAVVGCTLVVLITMITDNLFQRPALMWPYWALVGAAMWQVTAARSAEVKRTGTEADPVSFGVIREQELAHAGV